MPISHDVQAVSMSRLFHHRDIQFLRALPGFTPKMEADFRQRRCRIFRSYLRALRAELLEINTEFDTLAVECPQLRQELALAMLRGRMRFALAMIEARVCLWRYRWAIAAVECGPVIQRLESIRSEMRRWIPEIS